MDYYRDKLKEFLKTYKNYIEDNDFESLYSALNNDMDEDLKWGSVIGTSDLTSILMEADINFLPYMKNIMQFQFAFLNKLEDKGINKLVIPRNIDRISDFAFYSCSKFNEIWIPKTIKYIGLNAFYKLKTTIYYEGSEKEFNELIKEEGNNFPLVNVKCLED